MKKREFKAALGEGMHTAFRKAGYSVEANQIWHLINKMEDAEWSNIIEYVARGFEVSEAIKFEPE